MIETNVNHDEKERGFVADSPPVMSVRAALTSVDSTEQIMARALQLLMLLVDPSRAVFFAVGDRLEKLVDAPIVYALAPSVNVDIASMIDRYRAHQARDDPFAPRRLAQTDARVVTPRDIAAGDPQWRAAYTRRMGELYGAVTLASLTVRDAGRIIAGISLIREVGAAELSPGELAVLRGAQPLIEQAYILSRRTAPLAPPVDLIADAPLTPRERQIAALVAQGASNREIAQTLQVATTTVKTHVRHLFAKLGVSNRRQALPLLRAAAAFADTPPRDTLAETDGVAGSWTGSDDA